MKREKLIECLAHFTWLFGQRFHVELLDNEKTSFMWSSPEYGGDNTFTPCASWKDHGSAGRDKGIRRIREFCGSDIILVKREVK